MTKIQTPTGVHDVKRGSESCPSYVSGVGPMELAGQVVAIEQAVFHVPLLIPQVLRAPRMQHRIAEVYAGQFVFFIVLPGTLRDPD